MFSDMANEFRGSVCGESRWNIPATTPFPSFSPCFTTASTTDLEAFGSWDMKGILSQCSADDSDSGSNVGGYFMAAEDWTQTINMINNNGGGGERNYPSQILLQEQMNNFHGDSQDPSLKPFNLTSTSSPRAFFLDQMITTPNSTYGFSQQQQSVMAYHPASTSTAPNFSTSTNCLSTHDHHHQVVDHDQLSIFSDQAPPMWNNTVTSTNFFPSSTPSSLMANSSESDHLEASTSTTRSKKKRSYSAELLNKRPRIETPSPLPSFKVRKEKMGDRITALQQLVSPFGKTDTASVLHEAIDYIKFLHGQVNALCNPHLKNGNPTQHHQINEKMMKKITAKKVDLKSRGLCVVPISSTFPVASETTADFWTPTTFGGGAFTR